MGRSRTSVSPSVLAAFLVIGVQHNVNLQYGALLQPVIEKVIREEMQGFKTHLAWLLVRIAFDTGQTRSLATNILNRQPGLDNDAFRAIVTESAKAAKSNLTRRTPQLTELYEAVERWMEGRIQFQHNSSRKNQLCPGKTSGKQGSDKANIDYIAHRENREGENVTRRLFGHDGEMSKEQAYQMIDEAGDNIYFYRIMISPDPENEDARKTLTSGH